MSTKIQWTKPQLIVLARGTPEEAVLLVCKNQEFDDNAQIGADTIAQTLCNRTKDDPGNCAACHGVTGT